MPDIVNRKDQHLDVILAGKGQHGRATGFDGLHFVHEALPDLDHGKIDLEVIEVQTGSYLGEDDIVRFDDAYNRA